MMHTTELHRWCNS